MSLCVNRVDQQSRTLQALVAQNQMNGMCFAVIFFSAQEWKMRLVESQIQRSVSSRIATLVAGRAVMSAVPVLCLPRVSVWKGMETPKQQQLHIFLTLKKIKFKTKTKKNEKLPSNKYHKPKESFRQIIDLRNTVAGSMFFQPLTTHTSFLQFLQFVVVQS